MTIDYGITVCLFNSTNSWGGGENWHYLHAIALHELGYNVLLVANKNSDLFRRLKALNSVHVEAISIHRLDFVNVFKFHEVKKIFSAYKVDLVIFNDGRFGNYARSARK